MAEAGNDLKIAGSGTVAGGRFNRVAIAGQGDVDGDLDCVELKITGCADVRGHLVGRTVKITGSADMEKDVKADEVRVMGTLTCHGKITATKMTVRGSADVAGGVAAQEIEVSGVLTTKGDCEAESFAATGVVTIGGMLNAGNIDIKPHHGGCRAGEVGGEKISIGPGAPGGLHRILRLFQTPARFTTGTVEGDDIHLEHTRAKTVRGNNVVIGPGCEIELVEYRDTFDCDRGATVKEHKKTSC